LKPRRRSPGTAGDLLIVAIDVVGFGVAVPYFARERAPLDRPHRADPSLQGTAPRLRVVPDDRRWTLDLVRSVVLYMGIYVMVMKPIP
jgi:hypothetical protein